MCVYIAGVIVCCTLRTGGKRKKGGGRRENEGEIERGRGRDAGDHIDRGCADAARPMPARYYFIFGRHWAANRQSASAYNNSYRCGYDWYGRPGDASNYDGAMMKGTLERERKARGRRRAPVAYVRTDIFHVFPLIIARFGVLAPV